MFPYSDVPEDRKLINHQAHEAVKDREIERQIIDTESSRPRYVRRVIWTIVTVFLVVGLLAIAFALHFPGK